MDLKSLKVQDIFDALKELAGAKSENVVGIDIGLSAVKVAEMSVNGDSIKLEKYASVKLPEASFIEDEIQKSGDIVDALNEALKKAGIKEKNACLGLFGPNTIVRKLSLAGGSDEEVEDQVLWEAEQYLPFPVEDSNLDHFIVRENEGGGVDTVVAAVRNDVLINFSEIISDAGLKFKIADISTLAMSNIFEYVMGDEIDENENSSHAILDFGAQTTKCIIYKHGMPIFTKEITVGGAAVTEEIQRQLGVNYYEAEDLKTSSDEETGLPEEVAQIANDVSDSIILEVKKTIDFYVNSTSDDTLQNCYVTGGTIRLPSLLENLSDSLGLNVSVLNPFRVIEYSKSFSEDELNEIAYCGMTAMGLGIRKVNI